MEIRRTAPAKRLCVIGAVFFFFFFNLSSVALVACLAKREPTMTIEGGKVQFQAIGGYVMEGSEIKVLLMMQQKAYRVLCRWNWRKRPRRTRRVARERWDSLIAIAGSWD